MAPSESGQLIFHTLLITLSNTTSFCQADAETTIHSLEDVDQNLVTPTTTTTNASAPLKPSDVKFSQFERSDDDDSEDDVPLSDLSRGADDQHVGLKRNRPSSPAGPDEEPTRSKRRSASCCMKILIFFDG